MPQVYINILDGEKYKGLQRMVIELMHNEGWEDLTLPEERVSAAVAVTDESSEAKDMSLIMSGLVLFLSDTLVFPRSYEDGNCKIFTIPKSEVLITKANAIRQLVQYPGFVLNH